ncbi:MAG: hypothetical protein ACLPWF_00910 [Bryobacteraceae bacterium]|jgi:hypothetical protein
MTNPGVFIKLLALAVLLFLFSSEIRAQDGMRLKFGTWNLNLKKSNFAPGTKPRSDIRIYQDQGHGFIRSMHMTVSEKGEESITTYSAKFDGKEYPVVTRGSGIPGTIAFRVIDANSESFVLTRNGKVAVRGTTTISIDGKTLTMTLNRIDEEGPSSQTIDIYDRR